MAAPPDRPGQRPGARDPGGLDPRALPRGQPSGAWDARTKGALERYQAENGWQTKRIPDARALIKLGLGPDHANLINPGTAALGETNGKGGNQN